MRLVSSRLVIALAGIRDLTQLGRALLFSAGARPLRFACTGGLAGLTQLSLLALLLRHGWHPQGANALAFLVAAQFNFVLSYLFTWHDRPATRKLWRSWIMFHGSIAGMAVINMLAFTGARMVLPPLIASAVGIGVAAIGNFTLGDRLVFRARGVALHAQSGHDSLETEATA